MSDSAVSVGTVFRFHMSEIKTDSAADIPA